MNLKSSHKIPLYNLSSPLGQSVNIASDQKKSGSSPHFHSRNGDHGTATILTCLFDRPCLLEAQDLHLKKASRHRQNMWIDILMISDVLSLLLSSELHLGLEIGTWIFHEAIETRTISYHFAYFVTNPANSRHFVPYLRNRNRRRHFYGFPRGDTDVLICFKIEKNPLIFVYLRRTERRP